MSDYMPKCATCEHFESCIMQKHITEMALILWNISREKEKERTVNKPRRKRERVMTKEEQFVNELIGYIFAYPDDDYMTMECLCRKLVKHGLIDKVDGYYEPKESE